MRASVVEARISPRIASRVDRDGGLAPADVAAAGAMARLFAAIRLDDASRRLAVEWIDALVAAGTPARFERPEKLHVTLAFLGSVASGSLDTYEAALAAAAAGCEPFDLQLDRLGGFPNDRHPTLLWLGSSAPQRAFQLCVDRASEAFAALGSHESGNAEPHVTLCRAKLPLPGIPNVIAGRSIDLAVREIVLYESVPDGSTTRYEVRTVAPLGKM